MLLTRPMWRFLISISLAFGVVFVYLPAAPIFAHATTGKNFDAGLVNAVFAVFTVVAEVLTPRQLSKAWTRRGLMWSAGILGLPSLVLLLLPDIFVWQTLGAAIRGVGFGITTVVGALLVADLSPPGAFNRALGLYGLAISIPTVIIPPTAIFLALNRPPWVIHVIGIALSSAGMAAARTQSLSPREDQHRHFRPPLSRPGIASPAVASLLTTAAYAGPIGYLALLLPTRGFGSAGTFFFAFGIVRIFSRGWSGKLMDRFGSMVVFAWGAGFSVVGGAILATMRTSLGVFLGAVMWGIGSGLTLSAAYAAMLEQSQPAEEGVLSAIWNISIDGGLGVGSLIFAVVATVFSTSAVLPGQVVVLLGAAVVAVAETQRRRKKNQT